MTLDRVWPNWAGIACEKGPAALLQEIGVFFRELGLFGETLYLDHRGKRYRVFCDEHAFIVYRVNDLSSGSHHVPGWPVCLVDGFTMYEEHGLPGIGDDHCAGGADIEAWLGIVESSRRAFPQAE